VQLQAAGGGGGGGGAGVKSVQQVSYVVVANVQAPLETANASVAQQPAKLYTGVHAQVGCRHSPCA
jgi:hypothetical protein